MAEIKPYEIWPHSITVGMMPLPSARGVSGIHTVLAAYKRVFPRYGMEIVPFSAACDVSISHAGMTDKDADIAMLHGLYFTAHYNAANNEWRANEHIANSVRASRYVTVPSPWVGETIRRDLRMWPVVIPHGVFFEDFQGSTVKREPKTVFWGKNRIYQDVCDPSPLVSVASAMPDYTFLTTVVPEDFPPNVIPIGLTNHYEMKNVLSRCSVVLSTVKETWGILYVEAMACGTPVVTVNRGHVPYIVPHGVAGYTHKAGDVEDMVRGIRWCERNGRALGENGRKLARRMTWDIGVSRLRVLCESITVSKQRDRDLYNFSMRTLARE